MYIGDPFWNEIMVIIGAVTLLIMAGAVISAVVLALITFCSIRQGRFYFPRLLKSGFVFLEGLIKAFCRVLGIDDQDLLAFLIKLHNTMNTREFEAVTVSRRAIFLPQCLRSSQCPADLTPEGLKCRGCGQCTIADASAYLRSLGYHIFIIPGSTFIKRMVRKYQPEAILGIGCLMEVKEGLEMCDKMGMTVMGVVTLRDGCVETLVNWEYVFEIARLGLDPAQVHAEPQFP